MSERKQPDNKAEGGSREGKTMIGAYVGKEALYKLQRHLLDISHERGEKMTMQDFILSAIREKCHKDGLKIDI